jgi:pimeloyl-ACP methyl ester carboxylesterase
MYLAPLPPRRLIVFVHGFYGGPLSTWQEFPHSAGPWWQQSDMLFVSYDSARCTITGVADEIRARLPAFYPKIRSDLLSLGGVTVREHREDVYEELVLVGHSLGGLIVRRALCDVADEWRRGLHRSAGPPPLLQARTRLFSPASAGFRPGGWTGMLRATMSWGLINLILSRSPAYTDMQPGSAILENTRRRTEYLVAQLPSQVSALIASIAWAHPDNVVLDERYDTDGPVRHVAHTTHKSVCKPTRHYAFPRTFVQTP